MRDSHLLYHAEAEFHHWWFAARREIVLAQLEGVLEAGRSDRRLLDIGCGAGGFLAFLGRYGHATGIEASPEAVEIASRSGADVRFGSLPGDIPVEQESVDVITLLDVLEHVEEDLDALRTIRDRLRPGGHLILTVPAFPFLWSGHDVVNEHKRRYVRSQLDERLRGTGFEVLRTSYFNTLLFPPIALLRILRRPWDRDDRADEGRVPALLNGLLRRTFGAERWFLKWADLPFGVSLLAVARRPTSDIAHG